MSERDEFLENGLGRFLRFLNNEEWINTKKLRENGSNRESGNDLDLFCSMVFTVAKKKKMIRTVSMGKRRYRSTYVRYNGELIHVYECLEDGYKGATMMGDSVREIEREIAIELKDIKE